MCTLQNWWDNYLTEQNKADIQNTVSKWTVVKTDNGVSTSYEESVDYAASTLNNSIAKHFVGEQRLFKDRSSEILNNLLQETLRSQMVQRHVLD